MHAPIWFSRNFFATILLVSSICSTFAIMPTTSLAQTPTTVTETNVITFAPPLPAGDVREGSCWTTSIAVTRPGAYRCSVGNAIQDPCFAVPPNPDKVVCGADPVLKRDGFTLKLTKPLPTDTIPPLVTPQPWIIKLADGSSCVAMTGTLVAVNGEPARWSCSIFVRDQNRRMGVLTKVTPGKVWTAERFSESDIRPGDMTHKAIGVTIPVRTIWE